MNKKQKLNIRKNLIMLIIVIWVSRLWKNIELNNHKKIVLTKANKILKIIVNMMILLKILKIIHFNKSTILTFIKNKIKKAEK